MSAKKYKRMQKKCEDYRRSGRREINKAEKQKRHLARIEHFAFRKEAGKSYVYTPPTTNSEKEKRTKKNVDRRVKIAQLDSWFGKLEYASPLAMAIFRASSSRIILSARGVSSGSKFPSWSGIMPLRTASFRSSHVFLSSSIFQPFIFM